MWWYKNINKFICYEAQKDMDILISMDINCLKGVFRNVMSFETELNCDILFELQENLYIIYNIQEYIKESEYTLPCIGIFLLSDFCPTSVIDVDVLQQVNKYSDQDRIRSLLQVDAYALI